MIEPVADQNPLPTLQQPLRVDDMIWLQAGPSAELAIALEATRSLLPVHVYEGRAAFDSALRRLAEQPIRFVVFAQPRRGMWNADDVESVHNTSMLPELIGVYGSWCEGWQRTGHPLPGVQHHYWHQWPLRAPRLMLSSPPSRTATTSEQRGWLACQAKRCQALAAARPVAVSAEFRQLAAIRDTLHSVGWKTVVADDMPTSAKPVALIWDGDIRDLRHRKRLEALRTRLPTTPLLALTVAPRLEDWQQLQAANAAILSKPNDVGDLYGWLADLTENERSRMR